MSNRTDFDNVAIELQRFFGCTDVLRDRIAVELHDAFVAGQESTPGTDNHTRDVYAEVIGDDELIAERDRLARTVDRKDEQMAELQEALEKERQRADAAERHCNEYEGLAKSCARERDEAEELLAQRDRRIAELVAVGTGIVNALSSREARELMHRDASFADHYKTMRMLIDAPASRIPAQTITSPASAGIRDASPATATPMSTGATTTADTHGSTARDVRLDTYNKDKL